MSSDDKHVITVLGPVAPAELGVTDAHSHLYIGRVIGGSPDAPVLMNRVEVTAELTAFKALGGGAIVDCQPGGCGRDGRMLYRISRDSGVHVVAATGFHRRIYYVPDAPLWRMDADAAATRFLDEIRNGLPETRITDNGLVYPGFIKIAAEASLAESPAALFDAAATACCETGYAIEMHTEKGAAIEDFLAFFVARGVDPERLVFCHVDKRPDFGLHREMAEAGVMLEYDTFYRPKYQPESYLWPLIGKMVGAGLAENVALATDMAEAALWANIGGGHGVAAILTDIRPRLLEMGLPAAAVRAMLGGNIAGRLAVPVAVSAA